MPAQSSNGNDGIKNLLKGLANKGRQAHEAVKDEPVSYGNAKLPEGIENGVAQLVDAKLGVFKEGKNKGKLFFMAAGVVLKPTSVDGVQIEGMRTQIGPEPLADTPEATGKRKTFNDHYAWIINELAKLGVDKGSMGFDDLESTVQALKEASPFFKFRTWKGKPTKDYPDPRVNEEWNGACDYTPDEGSDTGVEDGTAEPEPEPEPEPTPAPRPATRTAPAASKTPPPKGPAKAPVKVAPSPEPEPEPEPDGGELTPFQIMELGEQADGGDEDAQAQLTSMAEAASVPDEDVTNALNWSEVAALITGGEGSTEGGEEAPADEPEPEAEPEPEEIEPVKADVYGYRPTTVDPKTKKPVKAKKPIECEVVSVDKKSKTVLLKNLDDPKKTYKSVKWDELETIQS